MYEDRNKKSICIYHYCITPLPYPTGYGGSGTVTPVKEGSQTIIRRWD